MFDVRAEAATRYLKSPLTNGFPSWLRPPIDAGFPTIARSLLALLGLGSVAGGRRRARVLAASLAGLVVVSGACTNQTEYPESEPIDLRDNEIDQGLFECTETSGVGYENGVGVAIKLVTVDARPVEVMTANAYIAMQDKAQSQGVSLRIVSGFRTNERQSELYQCYVNCNCNECNLAAPPGYSNHQNGYALDLNTSDAGVSSWLNNYAGNFGFSRTVPSEPWHWEALDKRGSFKEPCGGAPLTQRCASKTFAGEFCDDDGLSTEAYHDRLKTVLGVDFACNDIAGSPAFCANVEATRAQAMYVLGKAADMPLSGYPNAFRDDNGHAYEKYLDGAKAFGILVGYEGAVLPNDKIPRDHLAVMLARMYMLPRVSVDYFDDDDGGAYEDAHNRVAAAGLFSGFPDADGGRNDFQGTANGTRSDLAALAGSAAARNMIPIWDIPPGCVSGDFSGHFCDDDGTTSEPKHDRLIGELGLTGMFCSELAGSPRFCASQEASRAMSISILGASAGMPLAGHPDGFRDDNGHWREEYFDAAKAFRVIGGFEGGTQAKPNMIATRDMVAAMLVNMYALPATTVDYFTDDNGDPQEAVHNKVAAIGLSLGSFDDNGARVFLGGTPSNKGQLAALAQRAKDLGLVPTWDR